MHTDWLQWLTHRAGRSRTWWAPSVGEQVTILAVGGEPRHGVRSAGDLFRRITPAPSASADAPHSPLNFSDGAVIES
ncbi:phage baseplate assembly protein V [Escherichia coli]|nr:phage baseplate assembly protein V [Escherichia coli]